MSTLVAGDRIAYTAKFLKNTGQYLGPSGDRRGTYIGPALGFPPHFCRVRWDDIEAIIASGEGQFGDAEYVAGVRADGSLMHSGNIAKVNSPKFACNDL